MIVAPENYWSVLTDDQRSWYNERINKLERPAEKFNSKGLRFSDEWLHSIGSELVLLPPAYVAWYVDANTKRLVDNDNVLFSFQQIAAIQNIVEADYVRFNATTVGNLAYMGLYSDDDHLKRLCRELMQDLYAWKSRQVIATLVKPSLN